MLSSGNENENIGRQRSASFDDFTDGKKNKHSPLKRRGSATTFGSFKIVNVADKTNQQLKKAIKDLAKTKKRKEFEHDNKIQ